MPAPNPSSRRASDYALKFLGLLIVFGFFAGWLAVVGAGYELQRMHTIQEWPARRGVITQSYARQLRGHKSRLYWDVEIAGIYAGSEQRFYVSRVGYGIELSIVTRGRAEQMAARFPIGQELDVYYEPGNPKHAVLVRDNSPAPTVELLAAGLFFGLLPLILFYGFGRRRRFVAKGWWRI